MRCLVVAGLLLLGCSSSSFELAGPADDASASDGAAEATIDAVPDGAASDTAGTCGDRVVGPGEECDDGNSKAGDGCDPDCRFSCDSALDPTRGCAGDAKVCNGVERCSGHVCVSGTPTVCAAPDACTIALCVEPSGECVSKLIDADKDGQAPAALGTCGKDCDDSDPLSFKGQGKFFTTPTKRGGFDYDCDGVITKQYSAFVKCDTTGGGCTLASAGWFYTGGPVPECGATGDWLTECWVNASTVCVPRPASTVKQQQACR